MINDIVSPLNDSYYLALCEMIGNASHCHSRHIGAVLVNDIGIPIGTGWNGPPRGLPTCDKRHEFDEKLKKRYDAAGVDYNVGHNIWGRCPRYLLGCKSGECLELCPAVHAERACLINAAYMGIQTNGLTMYMDCNVPCTPCLSEIINAGIKEIIFKELSYYDASAEYTLKTSGLKWRLYGKEA